MWDARAHWEVAKSPGASHSGLRSSPAASTLGPSALITGIAILAIVVTILLAAVAQVGVKECVTCTATGSGTACTGTGSSSCPANYVALALTGAVLAVESFVVSLGLSLRALAHTFGDSPDGTSSGFPIGRQLALRLAAPAFMFTGWALVVLGLILPFGLFQICHQPCGYPYVPWTLSGYPLLLVVVGAVILSIGVVLMAIVSIQLRRLTPRRTPEQPTGQQAQRGPN